MTSLPARERARVIGRLNMRILQVIHLFPPEQSAGTERYTQALALALMARGHECLVLAGSTERASEPGVLIRGQDGLTVARLVGIRQKSGFRVDSYNAAADGLIRTVLDLWRPDLVHLQHWYRLTGNLVAVCAEAGIPVVVTLHDQWLACPRFHRVQPDGTFCTQRDVPCVACVDRDRWQTDQEIERELGVRHQLLAEELRLAGCLLVPSEAQRRFLNRIADIPLDRLQVVPLGSPVEWSQETTGERRQDGALLRIGYWGYLAPLKGVHTLLEAARLLAGESNGRLEWHLLGIPTDAAYYERLQMLAEGLPVTFHGPYMHGDVATLDFDVAVFPSLCYETYSFVLDEAFQLGLPVLVPDRGAPADRVGGRGMTFRAGDPRDLAQKLLLLLQEPHRLEKMRHSLPSGGVITMDAHVRDLEKIYHDTALVQSPSADGATTYRALLAHREQQLADRDQRLAERETLVEELSQQVTHLSEGLKNQQVQAQEQIEENRLLHDKLVERDQLIVGLRAELQAQVAKRDRLVADQQAAMAELHAKAVTQGEILLELQTHLKIRTQEADGLRHEVEESQRLLLDVRQSVLGSLDAALKRFLDDRRFNPKGWLPALSDTAKRGAKRVLPFTVRHRLRRMLSSISAHRAVPTESDTRAAPWPSGLSQDEVYLQHLLALRRPGVEASNRESHKRDVEAVISGAECSRLVIYPPTILWSEHLFQRPQQIFRSLAAQDALCFYCSANPALDRVEGIRAIERNLYLCSDPSLLSEASKRHDTVIWATRPDHRAYLDLFPTARLIYEVIDELDVFPMACDAMEQDHIRLLLESDVVTATAAILHAKVQRIRPDAILAPNGVRIQDFQIEPGGEPPPDLAPVVRCGRPIIGYYGALADWFDYELVAFAARCSPQLSFVLIGPDYDQTVERLPRAKNLTWLGPKPYDELPRYVQWFDVATIPFKINHITEATSPIKLFEYMAAGKPIVTTALPECRRYKGVIVAESAEGFVAALADALSRRQDPSYLNALREEAAENSWDVRVETILYALGETETKPLRRSTLPQAVLSSESVAVEMESSADTWLDVTEGSSAGPDILYFPINPWGFRFQRSEQLLRRFAGAGQRVYHIEITQPGNDPECRMASPQVVRVDSNLYQVRLELGGGLNLYQKALSQDVIEVILWNLDQLRQREMIGDAICLVAFPGWAPLAERLRAEFGYKIVYDCMDHHRGFGNIAETILALEEGLVASADLLVVSSQVLYDTHSSRNSHTVLVRNGADFDHFHTPTNSGVLGAIPKPIIGYYGAISSWFDVGLIEETARRRPDWHFVLIGHSHGAELGALTLLPNVHLMGEQPYTSLPGYLAAFDVCCIPFRLNDLTRATDPVKFYEYLCSGKPIVSVRLPELADYADCVYFADSPDECVEAISKGLAERDDRLALRRIDLGRRNTWEARYADLAQAIEAIHPKVSIIIVSYNTWSHTRRCLESVLRHTRYPHYEIIVVDNGSTDGSALSLAHAAWRCPKIRIIANASNVGFAVATNQGIAATTGDYVVLLNSDTVVTPGWLTGLLRHLEDQAVGLVGPVTNSVANEARVDELYGENLGAMQQFAWSYVQAHRGQSFGVPVLAMFCLAMRREVIDKVGLLDEGFEVGMFEDDDYALRVREAGYRSVCARDVFVHHHGRASFMVLGDERYYQVFEKNKAYFEAKWGRAWEQHLHGQDRPAEEVGRGVGRTVQDGCPDH